MAGVKERALEKYYQIVKVCSYNIVDTVRCIKYHFTYRGLFASVANIGTNPGLAALWEDERQRQRERGEDSQITPPDSPGKKQAIMKYGSIPSNIHDE